MQFMNNRKHYDNLKITQCDRILEFFEKVKIPLSTFKGRDELGIVHVSGRIKDLRSLGYKILTRYNSRKRP